MRFENRVLICLCPPSPARPILGPQKVPEDSPAADVWVNGDAGWGLISGNRWRRGTGPQREPGLSPPHPPPPRCLGFKLSSAPRCGGEGPVRAMHSLERSSWLKRRPGPWLAAPAERVPGRLMLWAPRQ